MGNAPAPAPARAPVPTPHNAATQPTYTIPDWVFAKVEPFRKQGFALLTATPHVLNKDEFMLSYARGRKSTKQLVANIFHAACTADVAALVASRDVLLQGRDAWRWKDMVGRALQCVATHHATRPLTARSDTLCSKLRRNVVGWRSLRPLSRE